MDYVKERRLICASKEIFKGRKIIDVSEAYGYETHSGFSKAFKKKFGLTPSDHLIYEINMFTYLDNKNGDDYIMNDNLKGNVFIQPSIDFKEENKIQRKYIVPCEVDVRYK